MDEADLQAWPTTCHHDARMRMMLLPVIAVTDPTLISSAIHIFLNSWSVHMTSRQVNDTIWVVCYLVLFLVGMQLEGWSPRYQSQPGVVPVVPAAKTNVAMPCSTSLLHLDHTAPLLPPTHIMARYHDHLSSPTY